MQSPDQDFRCVLNATSTFFCHVNPLINRYMSLNDLMAEIKTDPNSFLGDVTTENKVLKQVLQLVEDKISEVKNQAVKW